MVWIINDSCVDNVDTTAHLIMSRAQSEAPPRKKPRILRAEAKKETSHSISEISPLARRPNRTAADFLLFCDIILAYENYKPPTATESSESTESVDPETSSTSSGSSQEKPLSPPKLKIPNRKAITCFCGQPCGRRRLIECTSCSTWIHRACAKIRNNSTTNFICSKCRGSNSSNSWHDTVMLIWQKIIRYLPFLSYLMLFLFLFDTIDWFTTKLIYY